ncbi:MAG TPA: UvrD-helicase domain-containing protein, partial [Ideonella sp.]|nr:UvrD-helicase domain-containing protein [Ideonella sp.]
MQTHPLDVFGCALAGTTLIEASAGTGKTWAICGLYLRLLLEQRIEVPRLLVVTFTNAATAELRERIRARLAETLAALREGGAGDPFVVALLGALRERGGSDESMRQRLQQALHEFDEAAIFTIHGFCQRALADAPFAAGLPLAQQAIADDGELRLAVVRDFWRRRIAGDDALPPLLAAQLLRCKDNPERWARLLARRVAKPLSRVVWPTGIDAPAAVDADALAAAFAAARAEWQRDAVVDIVREALPRLNGNVFRPATVDAAAQGWDALFTAAELPIALPDRLDLFTPARLKPKKNQAPPRPHPFFAAAGRLHEACGAAGATLALHRLRLLRELLDTGPRELRAAKRARRVAAFDDLLFDVFERLGEAAFAAALAERFPAALIDEFQDTDPLQSAIFRAVYGGRAAPLFLVGDPKQAIYSFRNADLHTYLRSRDAAQARFTLSDNQRSSPALIEALNALFGANRRAFMLPGLEATPATVGARPRKAFADASAPRAALQLWSLPDAEPLDKPAALRRAMDACAGEIARLLGAAQRGAVLHDGRPLAAGDIAVLVRSHAHGAAMRRALAALGVGSVELSQASIYDSPDAEEVERVLLAVLEPARERLLRAALATEAMGRDAAALDALGSDEAALLAVVTRFAGYRASWLARGVGVMLREWMAGEGVAARLLGRPDGERRLTNLLHLAECLQEAAEVHAAPEALLRWLQAERRARRGDDAVQLRLESDRHLVQIVTIHKAKGLEYPIVFCPFLCDGHAGAPPNGTEGREYHDDAGEPVIDFGLAEDPAVKRRIALERAAESLRLVYVALTRAVQRCYLVVGRYRMRGSTSEACRSLLNWLVAGDGLDPMQWLTGDALPAERIDAA